MSVARTIVEEISAAKLASAEGAQILGNQQMGGILMSDGKPYALKHDIYRFTANPNKPWGHPDHGYTKSDLVPIHMHLDLPACEQTVEAASQYLESLRRGEIPKEASQGVELEGAVYKKSTTHLAPAYEDPKQNMHPELMETTLETATGKNDDGSYPNDPVSVARHIAQSMLEAHEHAQQDGNVVVHTSVPEGGNPYENKNTPIPYLQAFAPRVLADTLEHADEIPPEVLTLYERVGIANIQEYLGETGILNWPVNALHVHNGVPMVEGYADTRAAFAMAQVRNTEMAKILSFMLYNTSLCYGQDIGTKDGRSIMRRLLSTTHGEELPKSAEEYVQGAVAALENGDVHSLARYPKRLQHGHIRIRMDGVTMESIDAPMSPDLRLVLGWTYINQIMNVIALDALSQVGGDESKVAGKLQALFGELMNPLSAMGDERSSFAHDRIFNKEGFDGKAPWMNLTYREAMTHMSTIFEAYAAEYPAIGTYVKIVNTLIAQAVGPTERVSLEEYFGIENDSYRPNGKNKGILTDVKQGYGIQDLIDIQSKATRLQAEALSQVTDEQGLLAYFGIG
jgi:hypothetical protein